MTSEYDGLFTVWNTASAGILGHLATIETSEEEDQSSIVKINVTLSPSTNNRQCDSIGLALFDDIYWQRIRVKDPPCCLVISQ